MMTECDEIAMTIAAAMLARGEPFPKTFDESVAIVKTKMFADESATEIDNVAEALLQEGR